jgi:hypothetical protein
MNFEKNWLLLCTDAVGCLWVRLACLPARLGGNYRCFWANAVLKGTTQLKIVRKIYSMALFIRDSSTLIHLVNIGRLGKGL